MLTGLKTATPIDLKTAQYWVTNWVGENKGQNFVRAFLVHVDDLTSIMKETKDGKPTNYVRFYIGQQDPTMGVEGLHLILMAANGDPDDPSTAKDFIQKTTESVEEVEDEEWPLYDFSVPCPNTCDEGSALYITG